MKRIAAALMMMSAAWLSPAGAAPGDPPPEGTVAVDGGLRHEKAGVSIPRELGGMAAITSGGKIIMTMYMPANPMEMMQGKVALLGISAMETAPDRKGMAELARESFHETGVPKVVSEGGFAWPGHPQATTFHGVYEVGPYRKEYWRAWDAGWDATMIVTSPRKDVKLAQTMSAAVANKVFGGAVVEP